MNEKLKIAIDSYLAFLVESYNAHSARGQGGRTAAQSGDTWTMDKPGQNVVRILHSFGTQRGAHSFIAIKDFIRGGKLFHEGDILKTASWKAPTFNQSRGNVLVGNYGQSSWTGAGYLV